MPRVLRFASLRFLPGEALEGWTRLASNLQAMSKRLTRREFAASLGAAALASTVLGQDEKKPAKPSNTELMSEADYRSLESKLTKPLPAKLKGLAKTALSNSRNANKERMKFPLPEGSEPCTTFSPSPARSRDR